MCVLSTSARSDNFLNVSLFQIGIFLAPQLDVGPDWNISIKQNLGDEIRSKFQSYIFYQISATLKTKDVQISSC